MSELDHNARLPDERVLSKAALICVTVFVVRVMNWMMSELWYDEIVTLGDFVIGGAGYSLTDVFTHYPVANNHMLFSALMWCWVRLFDFTTAELLLRLPAAACGALTVWWVVHFWRRQLGPRLAFIAGLTMALSAVFTPFAYQMRGYAPSMLLVTVLVSGALDLLENRTKPGVWKTVPAALLLPLLIPSNVVVIAAMAAVLLLLPASGRSLRTRVRLALVVAIPGTVGACYYLTIADQFVRVMKQTVGWESGWEVAGNLALACVVHLGPVAFGVAMLAIRGIGSPNAVLSNRNNRLALTVLGLCLLPAAAMLIPGETAPFPRVFLMFLPPVTFAAFLLVKDHVFWQSKPLLLVAGLTVMWAFLAESGASFVTGVQVQAGNAPQDLLRQYYRGRNGLKELAGFYRKGPVFADAVLVTNAYDFPTFRYYRLRQTEGRGVTVAENRITQELPFEPGHPQGRRFGVVARNESEAAHLFNLLGCKGSFKLVLYRDLRGLYMPAD